MVRYVQPAHNHLHPKSQVAKAEVLYNFGREDELDRDAVRRLIGSLSVPYRLLGAGAAA